MILRYSTGEEREQPKLRCCVCQQEKQRPQFHMFIGWEDHKWIVCKDCASQGKHCSRCEIYMPFSAFSKSGGTNRGGAASYCKECKKKWSRENYKKNGKTERTLERERQLRYRQYGLTPEQYQAMVLAQNGVCASCGNPETRSDPKTGMVFSLAVDHDHKTGEIRELLCASCNIAFGYLKEDSNRIRLLLAYAEKWKKE